MLQKLHSSLPFAPARPTARPYTPTGSVQDREGSAAGLQLPLTGWSKRFEGQHQGGREVEGGVGEYVIGNFASYHP